jgi:hypothetical protein
MRFLRRWFRLAMTPGVRGAAAFVGLVAAIYAVGLSLGFLLTWLTGG